MQTKPSNTRKRILLIVCGTIILAALCYFLYFEFGDRVRAFSWHREHGDYVSIGASRLKLPAGWWPAFTDSEGTVFLWKAGGFMGLSSGIRVIPMPIDEVINDDNAIVKAEQKMVSMMNRDGASFAKPKPASLTRIMSPSITFNCVEETLYDKEFLLHCRAARVPYQIESAGHGKWEQETEAVLATWE
jgi:hypothetical protein